MNFTYCHYLNGLEVRRDSQEFETYQFLYYSPCSNARRISSRFHGNETFEYSYGHNFRQLDPIERVEGVIVNQTIRTSDGRNTSKIIITSLRFVSKRGEDNPYQYSDGITFTESYSDYILAYVTGKVYQGYIEQIQFFWYRT